MDRLNLSERRIRRAIKCIRRLKAPAQRAWPARYDRWVDLARDSLAQRDKEKAIEAMAKEVAEVDAPLAMLAANGWWYVPADSYSLRIR